MSVSPKPRQQHVVLHIGTEKTGTTSIQAFLVRNADSLAQQGILVPASALSGVRGVESHRKLPAFALDIPRRDEFRVLTKIEDIPAFRTAFARTLHAECRASPAPVVVMSSEHLASRVHRPKEIGRLKKLLDPIGPTTVVLYLRRQEDYLISAYSTAVRLGETAPLRLPGPRVLQNRYNYRALCERWAEAFGRDHVKVALFEPRLFKQPQDLILDFARTAGLALDMSRLKIPPRENQALDWRLMEFLRRFNGSEAHDSRQALRAAPYREKLLQLLTQLPRLERAALPQAELQAFAQSFAEDNAVVARDFLDRPDGVLFPPVKGSKVSAYTEDMPTDVAFRLFTVVWAELQEKGAGAKLLEELHWPSD